MNTKALKIMAEMIAPDQRATTMCGSAAQVLELCAEIDRLTAAAPVWVAASSPPDDELTVLLVLSDGDVWPGFRDGDVWRYVTADPIEASQVIGWMHMPAGPLQPPIAPMNRSTGMRCSICCAKAGEPHLPSCPENPPTLANSPAKPDLSGLTDAQRETIRFAATTLEGLDCEDTAGDLMDILATHPVAQAKPDK